MAAPEVKLFRKKPVEILAVQLTDDADWEAIAEWCGAIPRQHTRGDLRDQLLIDTLEGGMWANVNDWIIRGIKNEFYPCKPDIFAATYEDADKDTEEDEPLLGLATTRQLLKELEVRGMVTAYEDERNGRRLEIGAQALTKQLPDYMLDYRTVDS